MPSHVSANLLVGENGATSLAGRSRGLSFPEDRERFRELRAAAKAIAIGGATLRAEPYRNTPIPVYVASKNEPVNLAHIHTYNQTPLEVVQLALNETGGPVLIEGGVNFLRELLQNSVVNYLYITRSPTRGDGDFVTKDFLSNYRKIENSTAGIGSFETWVPINQPK